MLVKLLVANIFTRMDGNTFNLSKTKINKKKTMKVFVANLQIPCKDHPKKTQKRKANCWVVRFVEMRKRVLRIKDRAGT